MGSQTQSIEPLNPPFLLSKSLVYSNVPSARRRVYISAQLGIDTNGNLPDDFEGQVKNALQNILHRLAEAGGSMKDIAKVSLYVVNLTADRELQLVKALVHTLRDKERIYRPQSTIEPVSQLAKPEYLFQVDAVASIQESHATMTELPSNISSWTTDVIIIGAGLSGLQAARCIEQAGYSCVVLEAMNRVGGKTMSHTCEKNGTVDLGAAWFNDVTHPKIYELVLKYGLEPVIQPTAGDEVLEDLKGQSERWEYGTVPKLSMEDIQVVGKIYALLDTAAREADLHTSSEACGKMTYDEYLRQNGATGDAYELLATMLRALLGVEPREVSLAYYIDYIKSGGGLKALGSDSSDGAQYMRLRQGMQSIAKCLANDLPHGSIRLGDAALSINQETSQCVVKTARGLSFAGKHAIISVPTTLYDTISFSPSLPNDKRALSESTILGYYSKVILIYSSPWWRDDGLNGAFISFNGPISFTRDTSSDDDKQYSLTCFLIGDSGRKWSILSKLARQSAILDHLSSLSGEKNVSKVHATIEMVEYEWSKDLWCKGAPSPVMGPGIMCKYAGALRAPFGKIHFVGTETAYEWKGYMEGAIASGERGAAEILGQLKR